MEHNINRFMAQLPSVNVFIDNLVSDLKQGRSVLLLTPPWIDSDFISTTISKKFYNDDFYADVVNTSTDANYLEPFNQLAYKYCDSSKPPDNLEQLFFDYDLPETIIIKGIHELQSDQIQTWINFMVKWAEMCHSFANVGHNICPLFVVIPAVFLSDHWPSSELYFRVVHWCGLPSYLEMRLLFRQIISCNKYDSETVWREQVFTRLAGPDLYLLTTLMKSDVDDIKSVLKEVAEYRCWDLKIAKELQESINCNGYPVTSSGDIPRNFRKFWAQGLIFTCAEWGLTVHSAVKYLMFDGNQKINHLFWASESEVLMPLIDSFRLNVCGYMNRRFGDGWPIRWIKPDTDQELKDVSADPFSCQLGHLDQVCYYIDKNKGSLKLSEAVSCARRLRNDLAHYRPVGLKDFIRLHDLIKLKPI